MTSQSIRLLPLEIKKNGFTYKQINRTEDRFIYAQFNKLGRIISYEVFFNKLRDFRKTKERWAKLQNVPFNPEEYEELYEVFPSDEDFGKRAWTYSTLEKAMLAFESK
jgi:hypothetical protein